MEYGIGGFNLYATIWPKNVAIFTEWYYIRYIKFWIIYTSRINWIYKIRTEVIHEICFLVAEWPSPDL